MTIQQYSPTLAEPGRSSIDAAFVKNALRSLAGGVSVITAGRDEERTGATVTSATGFSMDPPMMIVCINKRSSSWSAIERYRHFCVNVLSSDQQSIADRFAGAGGVKGVARYESAQWTTLVTGAPALENALAVVDCEVEEFIERHTHAIILGRVVAVSSAEGTPLIYHQGAYGLFSSNG